MKLATDRNGNRVLKISKKDLGGIRGFSIQTNGNLPETHRNGICAATDSEVRYHVREFGTDWQKSVFGINSTKQEVTK